RTVGQFSLNFAFQDPVAETVDDRVFQKTVAREFLFKLFRREKMVIFTGDFSGTRKSRRAGDRALHLRMTGDETFAKRGFSTARRTGNDQQNSRVSFRKTKRHNKNRKRRFSR